MLKILDKDFNVLDTIFTYTSITINRRFYESGSFIIQLPCSVQTEHIKRDNFILFKGRYGIIKYIEITQEYIKIQGYDLKYITALRIAKPMGYADKAETVIKKIITDNTEGNRGFNNLTIAESQSRGNDIGLSVSDMGTVENTLKTICEDNDIGYDITIKNKKMVFDVVIPEQRDFAFSTLKDNISNYTYVQDYTTAKNTAYNLSTSEGLDLSIGIIVRPAYAQAANPYYKAEYYASVSPGKCYNPDGTIYNQSEEIHTSSFGGGSDHSYYVGVKSSSITLKKNIVDLDVVLGRIWSLNDVGSNYGISQREPATHLYSVYNGSTEPTGFERAEINTAYSETTTDLISEYCKNDLSNNGATETIEAEIIDRGDYGINWDLGDYVNIEIVIGNQMISVNRQITEVQEVYEPNNIKVVPTFGKQKDNVIKKIIKGR